MESLTVALALALVWTGLAAVVAHRVGLVTGAVCYLLARGVVGAGWGIGSQPQAVVVALVIVAWGYGAAFEWVDSWVRVVGGWAAPLALSGLTGLCLGAIPTFG